MLLRFSYNQRLMFKDNTQPPYAKFVLESLRKTVHNITHDPNHIQTLQENFLIHIDKTVYYLSVP